MSIELTTNLKSNISKEIVFLYKKNLSKIKKIQKEILGDNYDLSFVLVGETKSKKINRIFRGKDHSTDILSFPLSKKSGEIFLNPEKTKLKSNIHEMSLEKYFIFIVIHGFLHLKGMDHGSKMEKLENRYIKFFA